MKITRIETIECPEYGSIIWIRIHTDEGFIGLGETYSLTEPVKTLIERVFGPAYLLGKDPLQIEALWRGMFDRCNHAGWSGAEMRAMSAIDLALWDILGQKAGLPIYQLLGGACRDRIRIYNTSGPYKSFDFMKNADEYAQYLLETGIDAMKIWPFDGFARESGGQYLSLAQLEKALEPVRKVRKAVGNAMDLAIECHGHWNLNCAVRIAHALEEYEVMWLEDMIKPDNLDAYEQLSKATRLPLIVSERLLTRYQFLPVMQRGIARIINPDVEWCGGISEGKKIATMAETYQLPVAFHNYGGPLLNFASAHVAASTPNMMMLETGLNLLEIWQNAVITNPVVVKDGHMALPEGPGMGTALREDFLERDDVTIGTVGA
ncbi:MAG: mandelate racemase/muconate lactonizing enzyme family protein [Candidatus Latescibacterota bacterium]